jgi:hypothetical protein
MIFNLVKFETQAGAAIPYRDVKIIPFSRVLRLQIPGKSAGVIWNRPVSVATITPDGREHVMPIRDATRQAELALLGTSLAASLVIWLFFRAFRKIKQKGRLEPTQHQPAPITEGDSGGDLELKEQI